MNAIVHRLGSGERWWAAEAVLRGFGLLLFGLCALAAIWLYRSANQPPPHDTEPAEFLAAFVTVQGWCLGTCFLAAGPGLFRLVPDPRRHGGSINPPQGNSR